MVHGDLVLREQGVLLAVQQQTHLQWSQACKGFCRKRTYGPENLALPYRTRSSAPGSKGETRISGYPGSVALVLCFSEFCMCMHIHTADSEQRTVVMSAH